MSFVWLVAVSWAVLLLKNLLRQLGIRLAIDDFGTGNSAIDYLRRLPVDTLKIDRSFITDLGQDARNAALVRGMIALAKSLGLHVTGEGVETPDQAAHLQALGCDSGQGFLFAQPVAAEALAALLTREGRRKDVIDLRAA